MKENLYAGKHLSRSVSLHIISKKRYIYIYILSDCKTMMLIVSQLIEAALDPINASRWRCDRTHTIRHTHILLADVPHTDHGLTPPPRCSFMSWANWRALGGAALVDRTRLWWSANRPTRPSVVGNCAYILRIERERGGILKSTPTCYIVNIYLRPSAMYKSAYAAFQLA